MYNSGVYELFFDPKLLLILSFKHTNFGSVDHDVINDLKSFIKYEYINMK